MEKDFNDLQNNFGFQNGFDTSDIYKAYTYYKYLCMQMDYKIKCKEYEKLCNTNSSIKTT